MSGGEVLHSDGALRLIELLQVNLVLLVGVCGRVECAFTCSESLLDEDSCRVFLFDSSSSTTSSVSSIKVRVTTQELTWLGNGPSGILRPTYFQVLALYLHLVQSESFSGFIG